MDTLILTIGRALGVLVAYMLVTSCAVGPLSDHGGAQTSGKGETSHSTTFLPVISYNAAYGLTENTDIGAGLELQLAPVLTTWVKHKVHDSNKHIVSVEGGLMLSPSEYNGNSGSARGAFAGILWSGKNKSWRPYVSARAQYVHLNYVFDPDNDCSHWCLSNIDNEDAAYGQITLGYRYIKKSGLSLNLGMQFFVAQNNVSTPLPIVGVTWNYN